jgi:hypothetical protein
MGATCRANSAVPPAPLWKGQIIAILCVAAGAAVRFLPRPGGRKPHSGRGFLSFRDRSKRLGRLSAGIEHIDDIAADVTAGLEKA